MNWLVRIGTPLRASTAALFAIIVSAPAQAGLITHSLVVAKADYWRATSPTSSLGLGDEPISVSTSAGPYFPSPNQFPSYSGSATATAIYNPYGDALLKASAYGEGTKNGLYDIAGHGMAYAGWRDIVLTGELVPASSIRLNFEVGGFFDLSVIDTANTQREPYINTAKMSVLSYSNIDTMFDLQQNGFPQTKVLGGTRTASLVWPRGLPSPEILQTDSAWDSILIDGGNFSATFHLDIPYRASLGGYGVGLALVAEALARGSSSTVDFGHTLTLQSVTLLDGTPVNATFESGLQLRSPSPTTVTPEPTSLALAGFAGLGMAAGAWRRRRTSKQSAA